MAIPTATTNKNVQKAPKIIQVRILKKYSNDPQEGKN